MCVYSTWLTWYSVMIRDTFNRTSNVALPDAPCGPLSSMATHFTYGIPPRKIYVRIIRQTDEYIMPCICNPSKCCLLTGMEFAFLLLRCHKTRNSSGRLPKDRMNDSDMHGIHTGRGYPSVNFSLRGACKDKTNAGPCNRTAARLTMLLCSQAQCIQR